jgi:outer membrane protein OmpA-like peptidoglycan-associated protein
MFRINDSRFGGYVPWVDGRTPRCESGEHAMEQRIEMWRRRLKGLASVGAVVVTVVVTVVTSTLIAHPGASASVTSPEQTRAAVRDLAVEGDGFELSIDLVGPLDELPLGQPIVYRLESGRSAHLLIFHVDAHGVVTVLVPNGLGVGDRVEAGRPLELPGESADFSLIAEPPIGRESVLVVATTARVDPATLGLDFADAPFAFVEAERVPALLSRVRDTLAAREPATWSTTHLEQRVLGREEGPSVLADDVASYFTVRARAIRRPRLDLHIRFETGSAELGKPAQRNLDQVAAALIDQRMADMRFVVAGHTDAVGDLEYNDDLSARRAQAVTAYLVERHALDPQRFEVAHFGEVRPLESNDSAVGRQMNRRVEFELIR